LPPSVAPNAWRRTDLNVGLVAPRICFAASRHGSLGSECLNRN
jgi:hypothetical protein